MKVVKNVSRSIKKKVERELWGRNAGRCALCNKILYRSLYTKEPVQTAQDAHIFAYSLLGTRGNDRARNEEKINDISNLILLCPECHKLIDDDKTTKRYTLEYLRSEKANHERHVEFLTGIDLKNKSTVILLGSDIGAGGSCIVETDAYNALFSEGKFPSCDHPIIININLPYYDDERKYWEVEIDNLEKQFNERIKPLLKINNKDDFALFGLAPMPILIKMGTLLTDQNNISVFQRHRDTNSWNWQHPATSESLLRFKTIKPEKIGKKPVLVVSVSGRILLERISLVLGDDCSVWEITTDGTVPNNDNIKTQDDLKAFRETVRATLEEIRGSYADSATFLSIFPAISVSCSVALGLCRMPKSDLPWKIYDQNNKKQKFIETITIL